MLKNGSLAIVTALVLSFSATSAAQQRASTPALTTQDYIDIQQLNARYAVAIDECTNNGYDYAALYADDGWFSASRDGRPGTKWEGRERLAAAARGNMKTCDEVPWKGIKHMYVKSRLHVLAPGQAEVSSGRKPGTQR